MTVRRHGQDRRDNAGRRANYHRTQRGRRYDKSRRKRRRCGRSDAYIVKRWTVDRKDLRRIGRQERNHLVGGRWHAVLQRPAGPGRRCQDGRGRIDCDDLRGRGGQSRGCRARWTAMSKVLKPSDWTSLSRGGILQKAIGGAAWESLSSDDRERYASSERAERNRAEGDRIRKLQEESNQRRDQLEEERKAARYKVSDAEFALREQEIQKREDEIEGARSAASNSRTCMPRPRSSSSTTRRRARWATSPKCSASSGCRTSMTWPARDPRAYRRRKARHGTQAGDAR